MLDASTEIRPRGTDRIGGHQRMAGGAGLTRPFLHAGLRAGGNRRDCPRRGRIAVVAPALRRRAAACGRQKNGGYEIAVKFSHAGVCTHLVFAPGYHNGCRDIVSRSLIVYLYGTSSGPLVASMLSAQLHLITSRKTLANLA